MAVSVTDSSKTLKRKKSKSKKDDVTPVETIAETAVEEVEDEEDERARKRRRKEEKKRRKAEEAASTSENVSGAATPAAVTEDAEDVKETKEEKKARKAAKKAKKAAEAATNGDTPVTTQQPDPSSSASAPSKSEIESYLAKHSISLSIPASTPTFSPYLSFAAVPVPSNLRSAFGTFKEPTPIQACAWPPLMKGRDVVGIAETGSGKTLAFGIPALSRLLEEQTKNGEGESKKSKKRGKKGGNGQLPRVLILAPTRELALQSHDVLAPISTPLNLPCVALFGGAPKQPQVEALRSGASIVVGTPGRIKDLVNDGELLLGEVDYLVLDEADRMLDKGFENDIRAIIGYTEETGRQTVMFSATWPEAVRRLAASFQHEPVRVTVGSEDLTANTRVSQQLEVFDDEREKDQRLQNHLRKLLPKNSNSEDKVLVFALYKKEAARVEMLLKRSYAVTALHGDMSQSARLAALQSFRDGESKVLVATDVAARGLDIPSVAAVVNYSFPLTVEDYVHRIGRTGRGGKTGRSITFFTGGKHERALAGELSHVLREGGFDAEADKLGKFPQAIKKKTHAAYGAFFRDDVDMSAAPTKITFDD
ncbi:unnamed protein product [Peniophora sp. CBMAI 1063]|nr:unnamed protein product [Peniophora sp. CBMAI 1063]